MSNKPDNYSTEIPQSRNYGKVQPVLHEPAYSYHTPEHEQTLLSTQGYIMPKGQVNSTHPEQNSATHESYNQHRYPTFSEPNREPSIQLHETARPFHEPASRSLDITGSFEHQQPAHVSPDIQNHAGFEPLRPTFHEPERHTSTGFTEFTQFLMKKELILQRLSSFDDKPEHYSVWKTSFVRIKSELNLCPSEEFDLLIKYLGPESVKHAKSLRASNPTNPTRGILRLWQRLDERYGSPEIIERALQEKLANFQRVGKDMKKLYELSDILSEIESVMEDPKYETLLSYFNSSMGVLPIVNKLPTSLQNKWTSRASKYKKRHTVSFPPFTEFCDFIREQSTMMNDPGLVCTPASVSRLDTTNNTSYNKQNSHKPAGTKQISSVTVRKTQIDNTSANTSSTPLCPIHETKHSLNDCRGFRKKTITQRKQFLRENNLCFRCCETSAHIYKNCTAKLQCSVCGSDKHPGALHNKEELREKTETEDNTVSVSTRCTKLCGQGFTGRSCAKTVLVNIHLAGKPDEKHQVYVIMDDQSNRTLGHPDLFKILDISDRDMFPYKLISCAGGLDMQGRKATDVIISSLDGSFSLVLPTITECAYIPSSREEIPTPEVKNYFDHLADVEIPPLNDDASILLLVGRDVPEAHHIIEQRTGPKGTPFAQKLGLGWTIIGEVCLDGQHLPPSTPSSLKVLKTTVMHNGRPTTLQECDNSLTVKDQPSYETGLFERTAHDDKIGLSIEDKEFLCIMDQEFQKDKSDHWTAPLPFRKSRPRLPNNKPQALKRARILDTSLKKDPVKRQHFFQFMDKLLENGHAEEAPPIQTSDECWYLPVFGVYHPQKRDQIRAVFDSSAKFNGVSLNDVLLSGPDLNNTLIGVLLRFRKGTIAVTADIQQMFYQFYVHEKHRDFLRFLWYRNNNIDGDLIEYRMKVHVFGNSPSPAVATYGLRKTAECASSLYGKDIEDFVNNNFYVDDGLVSLQSAEEIISLVQRTQKALSHVGKLRLHKIASNSTAVLKAFENSDLSSSIKDLDLDVDTPPVHRSLGLCWNIAADYFTFHSTAEPKPYSRRGVLATMNSLYDPLGFAAPVSLKGKLLLRDHVACTLDWDDPLPEDRREEWETWRNSLSCLNQVQVPRQYVKMSSSTITGQIHIFSDASQEAIAAVAYMKVCDGNISNVGFVIGKAKVAPKHGHTVPRLELCAAVLGVQLGQTIEDELGIPAKDMNFYTDSKVVLGYLHNRVRRFYIYVSNRVDKILAFSQPDQWTYIPTNFNPADQGTRCLKAELLQESMWLMGPSVLKDQVQPVSTDFELVNPDEDAEVRPQVKVVSQVTVAKTQVCQSSLGIETFERFSSLQSLVRAIAWIIHIADSFQTPTRNCRGWHRCSSFLSVDNGKRATHLIIKEVQSKFYGTEIERLKAGKPIPKDSNILSLSPILDGDGLLRVGGRLRKAQLPSSQKNPLLIPGKAYLAKLIITDCHEKVSHQGRHFTEGMVRQMGYWISGGKRLIYQLISRCVKCQRLRGRMCQQQMSDLPDARLTPAPPFTYVGVDVFGPWNIVARRTRGGVSNSKRWAVMFTCLTCRAVHIELVEDMSSSSFINSLRRFQSIRGKVTEFRSDRGTNFVGASDDLHINAINVGDIPLRKHLYASGTVWKFNPPCSSHMGGSWERMIGVIRRVLDSLLLEEGRKNLTHEVLSTFMCEVMAIVNSRPITPVSSDPESPFILTPNILLTQKTDASVEPFANLDVREVYKSHWKHVQVLSEQFWKRWQKEFLPTLQQRRKWHKERPNLKEGDVVLMEDKDLPRNHWPLGVVSRVFPGDDGLVRKVEVRISRDDKISNFIRPVVDLVKLIDVQQ